MAIINCPECNKQISDQAPKCPGCGYPLHDEKSVDLSGLIVNNKKIITAIAVVVIFFLGYRIWYNSEKQVLKRGNTIIHSSNDNIKSSDYEKSSSAIFGNLNITDFSCSLGKYGGTMSCSVTNNNSFMVHGYFRVNFYDKWGKLIYNQLMSLPDVACGETVVCSTSIPKDDYPSDYSSVSFSQATLVETD